MQTELTHQHPLTKELFAALAGYLDGEGYIQITCPGRGSAPNLCVTVASGDKANIELLQKATGGTLLKLKPVANTRRQIYKWQVNGKHAQSVLRAFLPYLHAKRLPALAALACEFRPRGSKVPEGELNNRRCAAKIIKRYNNRITIPQESIAL